MMVETYTYEPCACGVHVCGASDDGTEPLTVANFPARSASEARTLFEAARAECAAVKGEPYDFIVDLCLARHEMTDDFPMHRQMLSRLAAICTQNEPGT